MLVQKRHWHQEGKEKAQSGSLLFGFSAYFQILEILTRVLFLKLYVHKIGKISFFHIEERGRKVSSHSHQHSQLSTSLGQLPRCSTRSLPSTGELLLNRTVYCQAQISSLPRRWFAHIPVNTRSFLGAGLKLSLLSLTAGNCIPLLLSPTYSSQHGMTNEMDWKEIQPDGNLGSKIYGTTGKHS